MHHQAQPARPPAPWPTRPSVLAGLLLPLVLGLAMLLAWTLPNPSPAAWPGWLSGLCIVGIFLLAGLSLPTRALAGAAKEWRLHLRIQILSLLLAPLLGLALDPVWAAAGLEPALRIGLLLTLALPTTISSCVVLTQQAGGAVPAALVNACLGTLLGLLVTPLWLLAGGLSGSGGGLAPVGQLALLVLAPLALGQAARGLGLRPPSGEQMQIWWRRATPLLLVVLVFATTTAAGRPARLPASPQLLALASIVIGLHLVLLGLAWAAGSALAAPARRTVLFCASQKTQALGLPLASVYFAGNPALPLIVTPLLIYHALQLLVGAWLAHRLRDRVGKNL